ncbi:MAG: hypothetical protein EOP04_09500 [Proteobacteria bacterium]|nr:MAG: hypothetical protein EOP04_09500 [Pseudomonadota bacterium]
MRYLRKWIEDAAEGRLSPARKAALAAMRCCVSPDSLSLIHSLTSWGQSKPLVVSRHFETGAIIEHKYSDTDFALSEEGMHLLRNGYCYQTVPYGEIEAVSFRNVSPVRSPLLALIIGIAFIGLSLLQAFRVYQQFHDPTVNKIYIEAIVVIVLPLLMGVYLLYVSLKNELLLIVKTGGRTRKLSVKGLRTSGKLAEAEHFLSEKLGTYVWA